MLIFKQKTQTIKSHPFKCSQFHGSVVGYLYLAVENSEANTVMLIHQLKTIYIYIYMCVCVCVCV
jgi:hypothetical protein